MIESHSEKNILKGCVALMQELTDEFEGWYRFVQGEDAIEELEEEEMFCLRMSYFHIVQRLFLFCTTHGGGTSTMGKCDELGVDSGREVEFFFERREDE